MLAVRKAAGSEAEGKIEDRSRSQESYSTPTHIQPDRVCSSHWYYKCTEHTSGVNGRKSTRVRYRPTSDYILCT